MGDPAQLPHLMRLIDDESPRARREIAKALASFGEGLEGQLARLPQPPDPEQRRRVQDLLFERGRELLREAWPGWAGLPDDTGRLESALGILAAYLAGPLAHVDLSSRLDALADEFRGTGAPADPQLLSAFLFDLKGIRGAAADYYHPDNSSLAFAIDRKRGLPITLACLYILVGRRLGLEIEGCNFPGHFLALASWEGEIRVVDCFDGGRFLTHEDFAEAGGAAKAIRAAVSLKAGTEDIVARTLRNLHGAFQKVGREADVRLMAELLASMGEAV
jgi:regulator of sirC expression with transglutaminase-like and TPR domain